MTESALFSALSASLRQTMVLWLSRDSYFFNSQLNIQFTPNLSISIPNFAPQN